MINSKMLNFNIEPHSLKRTNQDYEFIKSLYEKYKDDLISFCSEMAQVRKRIVSHGFRADFADAEAELLYLLIRECKPSIVVEISPCHGYSTNYILGALTHNQKGQLHSYEICTEAQGKPIEKAIRDNFSSKVDADRFHLNIGDAMTANIPNADFLFLDSSHESNFAAWYFDKIIEKSKLVFVHDIAISSGNFVLPKATHNGVREQYYVLQALAANDQNFISVADFDQSQKFKLRSQIPVRYPGKNSNLSIIFRGHSQNEKAKKLHADEFKIQKAKELNLIGDRIGCLELINELSSPGHDIFIQLKAAAVLTQLGYRFPLHSEVLPKINLEPNNLTVSQFVAAAEYYLGSCNFKLLRSILKNARQSNISNVVRKYIADGYYEILGDKTFKFRSTLKKIKSSLFKN